MDSSKSSNLVPDPPLLPPVFNLNDHIAAIDPVVGKFVTIPRTPGVRYPRSLGPTNGKVNLKLGPPSKAPDWHPLLEKWGLQVLDAAGFVNSTASNPFRTSLGPLSKHKPKVTGQQRHGAKHQIIHPVFREDLWEDLLEGEYKLMEPALRLASAIIDEPDTLGFFAGLTIPSEEMSWIYSSRLGRVPVFHATEPLKGKELIDIYNKVHNMRKYLKWKMVDGEPLVEELECFAVTSYVDAPDGSLVVGAELGTAASMITVSRGYTDIIRDYLNENNDRISLSTYLNDTQRLAGISLDDLIHLDESSVLWRSTVLFSNTLVHEFTHALCAAYFCSDRPPHMIKEGEVTPRAVDEPFFKGDRANEVGHAVSSWIFGGNPEAQVHYTPPQSYYSHAFQSHVGPFGLFWNTQWDQFVPMQTGINPRTLSDIQWNVPRGYYPVPQAHVNKLFDPKFWGDDVVRYGLDAIRMPKLDKWRVDYEVPANLFGRWKTGQDRWGKTPVPADASGDGDNL